MDIDVNYLNVIPMGAMNAKQLNEMIMRRHNTSGLKCVLKKKSQDQWHTWDYARLFSRYFNFSRGIPGIGIHAWINNIVDFQDNEIRIKYPESVSVSAFENFPTNQNWFLLLFVLHKSMSLDKFSRLTGLSKHDSFLEIEKLVRKGLVTKTDDNVFKINVLLYHLIVEHLQNNRLL